MERIKPIDKAKVTSNLSQMRNIPLEEAERIVQSNFVRGGVFEDVFEFVPN